MKRLILSVLLGLGILFLSPAVSFADFPENNKFGIHLAVATEEELQDAADLVNSSGGDWGYVTVVIEENDRDFGKWQRIFDRMRELHLIPIVRLATRFKNENWQRPKPEGAKTWADFLDSLNWVVKNRYVVLFNEPNDSREWGGKIDPQDYARVVLGFAKLLKEKNPDFFIIPAGLNATAPHQLPDYEKEETFLRQVFAAAPGGINDFMNNFDGWASHSYSTQAYIGELNLLRKLSLQKNLPVFVTETGWTHAEGLSFQAGFSSEKAVAQKIRSFYVQTAQDSRVVAVTPFILNYQGEPFDHFSWRRPGSPKDFYQQYYEIQSLSKKKGEPEQIQKLKVLSDLPPQLIVNSTYQIPLRLKNEGQGIWEAKDGYKFNLTDNKLESFVSDLPKLAPFGEGVVVLSIKTPSVPGKLELSLGVEKAGKVVSNSVSWPLQLIAPPDINLKVSLALKTKTDGNDFKFLIYNSKEEVIFEKTALNIQSGQGKIEGVNNLVIGERYRLVILKPYYLPRQTYLTIQEKGNQAVFKPMLPLDFNLDGKFSLADLWVLIKQFFNFP